MVIWGGQLSSGATNTGGLYNPGSDSWSPTSTVSAPSPRYYHSAVWSGTEMIVWGGVNDNTGGRYSVQSNTWVPTSTGNAPTARRYHSAVWTGTEMIIWGGQGGIDLNTGAIYIPSIDAWIPTSIISCPQGRREHTAVWTGTEMIIWGGYVDFNSGGKFNPSTNTWSSTSLLNAPSGRYEHTAIWTGTEMIVWGGQDMSWTVKTGGRYNPVSNTWIPTSILNSPDERHMHTAVWTGFEMIVWGGIVSYSTSYSFNTGARYNPSQDVWITITQDSAPSKRSYHTAVWTGTEMIIWGGYDWTNYYNDGARYNPYYDTWTPLETLNAPEARVGHTAVWTGTEMIIWGGSHYAIFNTGGKYNPLTNSWTPTSTDNAPSARFSHTTIWTGDGAIVWGGGNETQTTSTGGRYCAKCPGLVPDSLNVQVGGINQINVQWTAVPDASSYNLYRKYIYCTQEKSELIASNISGTTFIDTTVQGGISYSYSVTAVSQCESEKSPWAVITATGECTLLPCFRGVTSIINNNTDLCSATIQWNTGTSSCPAYPGVKYALYRSTDPAFIPGPGNLVASCITSTSYNDSNIAPALTFYYAVRAEDSGTNGSGPCNNGNVDNNIEKKSLVPAGHVITLFNDDFESSMNNWIISSNWNWNTIQAHSPIHSAHSGNYSNQACDTLTLANSISIPPGALNPEFHFWTSHNTEIGYDVGIAEYSLDGVTWQKLIVEPDYPAHYQFQGCFNYEGMGFSGAILPWIEYVSDLQAYAGKNILVRFNYQTNSWDNFGGWWIDDVTIDYNASCLNGLPGCSYQPQFQGMQRATSPGTSDCRVALSWKPAISRCFAGQNITYSIYRSIDPGFIPSSVNLIASCVTGTTYTDSNVIYGVTYYYVVRAEDSTNNGSGPCNNGNIDSNIIRKASGAFGPPVLIFHDDFEQGGGNWDYSPWDWTLSIEQSHSPLHAAFTNSTYYACQSFRLHNPLVPPFGSQPKLTFWTYFAMQDGWDGGVVRASSDNTAGSILTVVPDYPSATNSDTIACIGRDQPCFTGKGTSWNQYSADLSAFEGVPMKFNFQYGADGYIVYLGWWIDDVSVLWGGICSATVMSPGTVPDGDNFPGIPLTVAKSSGALLLNWDAPGGSCLTSDYGIYRGTLPWSGYNHASALCSTGGLTSASINIDEDSYYFLVAAQNNGKEGSYGLDSSHAQRPTAVSPCLPLDIGNCN